MSCSFEEDLSAYIDGELPLERASAMKAHIEGCAECRTMEQLIRRTVKAVDAAPDFEPSPDVRRKVLRSIAEQQPSLLQWLFQPRFLAPLAGAAALGLVVFAATRPRDVPEFIIDPSQQELAMNFDEVDNLDVLGMDSADDLAVISELHELDKETK